MTSNKVKYIDDLIVHAKIHIRDGELDKANPYIERIRQQLPLCHEGYRRFLEKTYKSFFEQYIYKKGEDK